MEVFMDPADELPTVRWTPAPSIQTRQMDSIA